MAKDRLQMAKLRNRMSPQQSNEHTWAILRAIYAIHISLVDQKYTSFLFRLFVWSANKKCP